MKALAIFSASLLALACSRGGSVTTTASPPSTSPSTIIGLDSRQIFERIAPSVAFVEGQLGTGSGLVVDERHLVTNLHVIWPGDTATITFSDGSSRVDAPVIGLDWMADLALIDLGSAPLPEAVDLADAVDLAIGSEVYLIGYPADTTGDPTPAITAGILSRFRDWEDAGVSFLQSDASISGGQSGGALVAESGQVIGLSGASIGDGGLALSLASPDVIELLDALRRGEDRWGLGSRLLSDLLEDEATEVVLPHLLAEAVFVFEGEAGDPLSFTINADQPSSVFLTASDGYLEGSIEDTDAEKQLEVELGVDGPMFLSVIPIFDYDVAVEVETDVELRLLSDPDHGQELRAGMVRFGNADYPGDFDWFTINLEEGDQVTIVVTTAGMDPGITVDWVGNTGDEWVAFDSDSAGGVLGFDSEVNFTAPVNGEYLVAVADESAYGPGGYIVTVEVD